MELAQLLAPSGAWGKVWLAAHWDKRLKKQDYIDLDLRKLVEAFHEHRAIVSLRTLGHLLFGVCKIYAKKCLFFDEEASEVRTALALAFSDLGENFATATALGEKMEGGQVRLLDPVDKGSTDTRHEEVLLRGKRHMARLEDITLKEPSLAKADPRLLETGDVFGPISGAELEKAMKRVRRTVFPQEQSQQPGHLGSRLFAPEEDGAMHETQPLVDLERMPEVTAGGAKGKGRAPGEPLEDPADGGDTPMPLEMDLVEDSLQFISPPGEGKELPRLDFEAGAGAGVLEGEGEKAEEEGILMETTATTVKKRRRHYYEYDEITEIPKEIYKGYVNDRSLITRKNLVDYTVLLPHYSPLLPHFTTTFTELCPQLCHTLNRGTQITQRRRKLAREEEFKSGDGAWLPSEGPCRDEDVAPTPAGQREEEEQSGATSALFALLNPTPPNPAGLQVPHVPERDIPDEISDEAAAEARLLEGAPLSLSAVVAGSVDQEDQTGSAARLGYSLRTEKMHRFLAREFKGSGTSSLSFEVLCRDGRSPLSSVAGRRELMAASFFELLVLRTNGVVDLKQEESQADIHIAKDSQWINR